MEIPSAAKSEEDPSAESTQANSTTAGNNATQNAHKVKWANNEADPTAIRGLTTPNAKITLPTKRVIQADSFGNFSVIRNGEEVGTWTIKHEDGTEEEVVVKGELFTPPTPVIEAEKPKEEEPLWTIEAEILSWSRVSSVDPENFAESYGLEVLGRRTITDKIDVLLRGQFHILGSNEQGQNEAPTRIEAESDYCWKFDGLYGLSLSSFIASPLRSRLGLGASYERYQSNQTSFYLPGYSAIKLSVRSLLEGEKIFGGIRIAKSLGGSVGVSNYSGFVGYKLDQIWNLKTGYEVFYLDAKDVSISPSNSLPFREAESILSVGVSYSF